MKQNKKLRFLLFPCLNSCLLCVLHSFKSMCNTNACGILPRCSTQHWWLYCGTGEGLAVMSLFWLVSTRQAPTLVVLQARTQLGHQLITSFLHPLPSLCPSFIHRHHCYVLPSSTAIIVMSFLHPPPSLCPSSIHRHHYVLPSSTAIIVMSFLHPPPTLLCHRSPKIQRKDVGKLGLECAK